MTLMLPVPITLVVLPVPATMDTLEMESHAWVNVCLHLGNSCYVYLCPLDIDECTTGADNCDTNAACTNNPGSFTCSCNHGYTGDGVTCMGICSLEFKQLFLCVADYVQISMSVQLKMITVTLMLPVQITLLVFLVLVTWDTLEMGSHALVGIVSLDVYKHSRFPLDIDECATGADNCDTNAACTNSPGSFACSCNQGYTGDGVTCMGICSLEFKQLLLCIADVLQMLMSVQLVTITVTLMLSVPTLLVASLVPVTLDTLEMELHVWVSLPCM